MFEFPLKFEDLGKIMIVIFFLSFFYNDHITFCTSYYAEK